MAIPPLDSRDSQLVSQLKRTRVPGGVPVREGVEEIHHSYATQRAEALKKLKEMEIEADRPNMEEWMARLDEAPTMGEVMDGLANLLALGE